MRFLKGSFNQNDRLKQQQTNNLKLNTTYYEKNYPIAK